MNSLLGEHSAIFCRLASIFIFAGWKFRDFIQEANAGKFRMLNFVKIFKNMAIYKILKTYIIYREKRIHI